MPLPLGNSGGALVDEHGNVIGVVSDKLNARAALAASGVQSPGCATRPINRMEPVVESRIRKRNG